MKKTTSPISFRMGTRRFRLSSSIERGHLQFDFKDSADNTITYTNTDLYGDEHLWLQSGNDGYGDTGYDYPVDDVFTLSLERSGGTNAWKVHNGGDVVWSNSMTGNDFSKLVIESWGDPVVEIREVQLENN